MSDYLETKVDKFAFKVAVDRFYSSEGIWALATDNTARLGLSDFLQQRSGDIAFVEVKPEGTVFVFGDEFSTIETIKVDISLSSPVSGKVIKVNPALEATPELINQDPFGEGWLCEMELSAWDADKLKLLTAEAYFDKMKIEAEAEVKRK